MLERESSVLLLLILLLSIEEEENMFIKYIIVFTLEEPGLAGAVLKIAFPQIY